MQLEDVLGTKVKIVDRTKIISNSINLGNIDGAPSINEETFNDPFIINTINGSIFKITHYENSTIVYFIKSDGIAYFTNVDQKVYDFEKIKKFTKLGNVTNNGYTNYPILFITHNPDRYIISIFGFKIVIPKKIKKLSKVEYFENSAEMQEYNINRFLRRE